MGGGVLRDTPYIGVSFGRLVTRDEKRNGDGRVGFIASYELQDFADIFPHSLPPNLQRHLGEISTR